MTVSVDLAGLQLPGSVEVTNLGPGGNRARFVLEPLERGFGQTLGNSLRRILLSALPGSAAWAFKADGVHHEHQTVASVGEDVHQIIQNIKQLVLRMEPRVEEARLELSAWKAGPVLAGQFTKSRDLDIVNPGVVLCTLQEDLPKERPLNMTLWVNRGRGFTMADDHPDFHRDDQRWRDFPLGTVRIDSIYNPVRRANFTVSETRVGQRTDFDRLELDVQTDGSLDPTEAVAQAAEIASRHLGYFEALRDMPEGSSSLFSVPDEAEDGAAAVPAAAAAEANGAVSGAADEGSGAPETDGTDAGEDAPSKSVLERPIAAFDGISKRVSDALSAADIHTLRDVVLKTGQQLENVNKIGPKALQDLAEVAVSHGYRLGMTQDEFTNGTGR